MRRRPLGALTLLSACLAAAATLTGCGGQARDGFVAVGAAGAGPERSAGQAVPPADSVELQPLPGPSSGSPASASGSPDASGSTVTTVTTGTSGAAGTPDPSGTANTPPGTPGATPPDAGTPANPDDPAAPTPPPGSPTSPPAPAPPAPKPPAPKPPTGKPPTAPAPGPTPPAAPAKLTLGTPTLAGTGDRWCEKVTVPFANTGGTAVRSGTVTFTVDILGDLLGARWGTVTTNQPLPAPIAGGSTRTQTYTVCVEAWRVPLGWHIDTRQVTATWR
ncbi:hypothetical protein [Streptomyces sp. NPDC048603]|uniref:hypothetical protein n=1 Tax=Streptomyces sp. NPDC048603 TaxID=3365577 RepID=UPI00370FC274